MDILETSSLPARYSALRTRSRDRFFFRATAADAPAAADAPPPPLVAEEGGVESLGEGREEKAAAEEDAEAEDGRPFVPVEAVAVATPFLGTPRFLVVTPAPAVA